MSWVGFPLESCRVQPKLTPWLNAKAFYVRIIILIIFPPLDPGSNLKGRLTYMYGCMCYAGSLIDEKLLRRQTLEYMSNPSYITWFGIIFAFCGQLCSSCHANHVRWRMKYLDYYMYIQQSTQSSPQSLCLRGLRIKWHRPG
jgi:uncharacterized protein YybS (DUF2232 family)